MLGARLVWPAFDQSGYRERDVCEVISDCLPLAAEGLRRAGIAADEVSHYLGVIEQRLARSQTGATWQLNRLAQLQKTRSSSEALHALLEEFIEHSVANIPVAEWPL